MRSFGLRAGRADLQAIWPDGRQGFGGSFGSGPPGTGANAYLIIERPDAPAPEGLLSTDPSALADYVRQRERRR